MNHLQMIEIESDIFDLCRAVKVISSVIADQLQNPEGPLMLSDHGLETQCFRIDASMVRYAVDNAADLALALRDKVVALSEKVD